MGKRSRRERPPPERPGSGAASRARHPSGPSGKAVEGASAPPAGLDRWDCLAGSSILVVALAARLLYVYQIHTAGLGSYLRLDPLYYHQWALRIAAGGWVGSDVFEMSPLYAYVLAIFYSLFGEGSLAPKLLQCALASVVCGLMVPAGRRIFGKTEGILAGTALSLYGPALYYDGQVMKTSLEVSFTTLMTLAFLLASRRGGRARLFWLFSGGVLLGLTALMRENILAAAPLLFLWVIWPRRGGPGRTPIAGAAALVIGTALPILPATAHNLAVSGDLVLITSLGGENFYTGNNLMASGRYTPPPFVRPDPQYEHEDFRREAIRRAGRPLTRREASRFWYGEGWRFIAENPGRFLWLLWDKLGVFFNDFERPDNLSFYNFQRFSGLLSAPLPRFAWVAPLGILGIALSAARWRDLMPLYVTLSAFVASALIFFTQSRYRMPAVPILCFFGAHALVELARAAVRRRLLTLGWAVPSIVVLTIFVTRDPGNTKLFEAQNHALVADMLRESGDLTGAEEEFRLSIAAIEKLPMGGMVPARRVVANAHLGLARTLLELGDEEGGIRELREASMSPRPEVRYGALRLLGLLLGERGDLDGAAQALRRAVGEQKESYEARMLYAEALHRIGRSREALTQVEEALRLRPGDPEATRIRAALAAEAPLSPRP